MIVIVIKISCICRDFFAIGRSLRKDCYCFNPEIILLLLEPASWNLQQANTRCFQTLIPRLYRKHIFTRVRDASAPKVWFQLTIPFNSKSYSEQWNNTTKDWHYMYKSSIKKLLSNYWHFSRMKKRIDKMNDAVSINMKRSQFKD